jgi:hypothetical protein
MGTDFFYLGTHLSQDIVKFITELNRKRLETKDTYEVETDYGIYRLCFEVKQKNKYYWNVYFLPLKPPSSDELKWIM